MPVTDSSTAKIAQHEALVNILLLAKAHFGLVATTEQVQQALPVQGDLTTKLTSAMTKISLDAALQNVDSKHLALPAIVINGNHQAYFITHKQQGDFVLLNDAGEQSILSPKNLTNQFDPKKSNCWYIKPLEQLDQRGTEHHKDTKRHWLLAAFDEVKPFYGSFLIGSLAINLLALVTPLFTMNVYDRVVPNQAIDTLWVLASGASIAIVFDWLLRQARTRLADVAGKQVDIKLSSTLFEKVIGMRLESRPASSGAFAKQLQEFDSIRDFITSVTLVTAVDLPFTLLFLVLIAWLGGVMVFVPLTCMVVLILLSIFMQKRLSVTIEESSKLSTQRQAHLVESLNMLAEIKQNNGQAKATRIWHETVSSLADWQNESRISSNTLSHSVMNCQQLVSIGLIITGVYQIHQGNLSMGGLIAIVMLSGRASSAINQIACYY